MNWKLLRQQAGLSQVELARLAQVSQSFIAKLESGKIDPTYSRVLRLEHVLQTRVLLDGDWLAAHTEVVSGFVWESQTIPSAIAELERWRVPGLPVKNEAGQIVGLFHLQPLLDDLYFSLNLGQKKTVADVMVLPPIVPSTASRATVLALLRERGMVLIGTEKELAGWVLPFSILKSDYGRVI